MKDIHFIVPAVPVAQPRPRAFNVGPYRSRLVSAPQSHPVNAFKASCRLAASAVYSGEPLACALGLSLIFVLPRPKSKIWKTKPMPREPHTSRPDTDNLMKSFKDSLTKLIWVDDSQVYETRAVKVIAAGNEQPHVSVTIWKGSL